MELVNIEYGLNILAHDKEWNLRRIIASRGLCLPILIDDPDISVREEVARQGYGLNKLIHDPCKEVSDIAKLKINRKNRKRTTRFPGQTYK